MSKQKVAEALQREFGQFLSQADQQSFIDCHDDSEFIGFEERSGAEYFALEHFKGYVQSYMSTQLEDAGYWDKE